MAMDSRQGNIYSGQDLDQMSEEEMKRLEEFLLPIKEEDYLRIKTKRQREVQKLFDRKGK